MQYYLARKHLGFTPTEWDNLPWWQTLMYLEGFRAEGITQDGDGDSGSREPGSTEPVAEKIDLASASAESVESFGVGSFTVIDTSKL